MAVVVEWGEESAERTAEMEAEARRVAEALGRLGAQLVILFGSRAKGRPRAHSDIDLIAVMPCDPTWTFARRLAEVGARVDPRYATDLLVYAPEEFEQLRHSSSVVREAVEHGRVLFPPEEDAAAQRRCQPGDTTMTDEIAAREARRWLRQAEEDLDAARQSADILGKHYLACFLAQQAAEKALKAIYYARGVVSVRGHSVAELCAAAEPFDPTLAATRPRLAKLDRYYISTRYPNAIVGAHPFEAFDSQDSADAIALATEAIAVARERIP